MKSSSTVLIVLIMLLFAAATETQNTNARLARIERSLGLPSECDGFFFTGECK